MTTLNYSATLYVQECCSCHMTFAVPTDFDAQRRSDKKTFYCPNGHSQSYRGESDSDLAQRLAGQLDIQRTRLRDAERQLDYARRSQKNVSTRLKKVKARIGHGVCPCCNRSFKALADHMATKHPEYAKDAEA